MFRIWADWSRTRIERCAQHELVYQARTFTSLADIAPVYNCFKVNPCFQKCKQWMVTQLRFRTHFSFLKSRVLLFVVILQLFSLVFFPQRQVIFSLERKLLTKRQLCASLIEVHQNRNICPLQSSVIKSDRESIDKLCLHALKYQVNCCLSRTIFSFCISVSVLLDID